MIRLSQFKTKDVFEKKLKNMKIRQQKIKLI